MCLQSKKAENSVPFSGEIAESDPLQINTVYAVYAITLKTRAIDRTSDAENQADISGLELSKGNVEFEIPDGSYSLFFKCPPDEEDTQWAMPVITLSAKDETFVFGHYTDSVNGFASGSFEIDGDALICKADDGKQYIFTISDTDTLCYVKDGSADLEVFEVSTLSHKEGETVLVEDGATFLRHGDIIIE